MRIAVLSDIHSNLAALEAVLGSMGTVDAVWHLGDVVGYGPEPDGVVQRLRDVDARAAAEWTRARIGSETRRYLAALPELIAPAGSSFTLVHGSPRHPIWEYLDSPWAAEQNLALLETPHCFVGHTHVPIVFRQRRRGGMAATVVPPESRLRLDDRRVVLNPGSVGQPRDGNPAASYVILDTAASVATWRRVAYDIGATQAAMKAAGLPQRLIRRLSFGQ
jgi:predicted phosphodiesterase